MSLRLNGKVIAGSSSDTPTLKSLTVTGGEIHRGNETHDGVVAMKTLKINGKDAATSDDISAINQALTNYPTNTQTDQKINNALEDYEKISQSLRSNTNLNDITTEGWYFVQSNSVASTITGKPDGVNYCFGLRVVKQKGANSYSQMLFPENSIQIYVRNFSTTWGDWQKLTTETDVNNALANYSQGKTIVVESGTDANTLRNIGFYRVAYNGSAYNFPNNDWGTLVVVYGGATTNNKPLQIYYGDGGRIHKRHYNGTTWTDWEKLTTESDLKPTITPITTTSTEVSIVDGGFSKIGNLVVVNFRFTVTRANTLITFATNVPYAMRPPIATKQYIPANVINIQQDILELCYGYKAHSSPNFIVNVSKINVEYALSCTYICS